MANVFETLLATDPDGATSCPALCEKWKSPRAGRAFRLTLRRDVSFSDGTPLTARAVKASLEASRLVPGPGTCPPPSPRCAGRAEYRAGTAGRRRRVIVARGDDELEIRLLEPLPIYPAAADRASARPSHARAERERRSSAPGRSASRSRDAGPRRPRAQPRLLAEPGCRGSTRSSSGRRSRRDRDRRGLPRRASSTSRATCCPQDLEAILREPRFRARAGRDAEEEHLLRALQLPQRPAAAHAEACAARSPGSSRPSDLVWRTLGRFAAAGRRA